MNKWKTRVDKIRITKSAILDLELSLRKIVAKKNNVLHIIPIIIF